MPRELRAIGRTSRVTEASLWMRELDQTGESGRTSWSRPGNTQSLPHSRDTRRAQTDAVCRINHSFSDSTVAFLNKPGGLFSGNLVPDNGCVLPSSQHSKPADDLLRRLRRRICARLDQEPLEDGVTNSAEAVVQQALSGSAEQQEAFARLAETERSPEPAAAFLRLAGRVGRSAGGDWRRSLVRAALGSSSVMLREAAVEAIEQWEDKELLPLLRAHTESVSWLKAYIDDVIDDLSE